MAPFSWLAQTTPRRPSVSLKNPIQYDLPTLLSYRYPSLSFSDMFNGFSWQTRTLEVRDDRIPPDLDLSNPLNALQFSKAQNSSGHVYPFIPPINGAFVNMDPVAAQIHARAAAEAQQALGLPVASPIPPSSVPGVHLSPNLSATGSGRMLFVGNVRYFS